MSKCEHKYKPDKRENGQLRFKSLKFSPVPVVRAHCVECGDVRHFTQDEAARLSAK